MSVVSVWLDAYILDAQCELGRRHAHPDVTTWTDTLRDLASVQATPVAGLPAAVEAALCDDLNTPAVMAELSRLAGEARVATNETAKQRLKGELLAAGEILGLLQQDPAAWLSRGGNANEDERIQSMIDERNAAKKAKDFARADALRDELAREGILLEDTAQGVRWRRG